MIPKFVALANEPDVGLWLLDDQGRVWFSSADSIIENKLERVLFGDPEPDVGAASPPEGTQS